MNQISRKFSQITPALMRHLLGRNSAPYERILQYVRAQKDIWITTQGDYISWWQERENATLSIRVEQGQCYIWASTERAVIEQFPGEFVEGGAIPCPNATFTGECKVAIDPALKHKDILVEILKREGILNYEFATTGDFYLPTAELEPLLADIAEHLFRRQGRPEEADVARVRQIVIDTLGKRNLPLLRVWYHPRVGNMIPKAVFSSRYDVDRAITNLKQIRKLERKYEVESTLYIRAFCPFYADADVQKLAAQPWCSEIALHGEFVTTARHCGDEFKAALVEKERLEKLAARPILGVGMHGGELANNRSENTDGAVQQAEILYDTTPRPSNYYFPFRKIVDTDGGFSRSYAMAHALADVNIPADQLYGRTFYERTIAMMDKIYRTNGVFVLMLHPVYFGLFSYLSRPKNLVTIVRYLSEYLKP